MNRRILFVVGVALAVTAVLGGPALANIYAPSFGDASSVWEAHQPTAMGVDLDAGTEELDTSDPNVMNWTHAMNGSAFGMYQSGQTSSPTIWICVPDPVQISSIILWNGFQDNSAGDCYLRSVKDFSVHTSTGRNSAYTHQYTGTLTQPASGAPIVAEAVNFTAPAVGHYVRIDVANTYGAAYTELAEIRFDAVKLASDIATPTSASASSYKSGYHWSHASPKRLFDGGYMNEPGVDLSQWSLDATSNALAAGYRDAFDTASAWVSNSGVADQWVLLDLGAAQDLAKIHLWNLNVEGETALGAKDFEVWESNANGDLISLLGTVSNLAQADGVSAYDDQAFDLTGAFGVQYVKLCNFTNWAGDDSQVGLSELRFEMGEVPEPSTFALLVAGLLGLLTYAWRKRK